MKVIVITREGKEISLQAWQKLYGLPEGSDFIGKYFSLKESRFERDIELYGELVVNELLMRVLDSFRELIKSPVTINSFNRNDEKQEELRASGARAAKFSPHVAKMAADIDTASPEQTRQYVMILSRASINANVKIRIGYEQYLKAGQTFIHVDVCPEYYAKGKPFHNTPHPIQWQKEITW